MRRFTSVLLSILLGGLAVGIGMGVFLKMANDDRERLATIATQAQQASKDAQMAREMAVKEANQKLENANAEISKAEQAMTALQQERDLIAEAHVLAPANARTVRGWKEAVGLDVNASCKFPPGNTVEANDGTGLVISQAPLGTDTASDTRWLAILPYDAQRETELQNTFVTSTPVSYLVGGRLLIGKLGEMDDPQDPVFVLRVQKEGVPTHLIWLKAPATDAGNTIAMNVLASLSFQD